MAPTEVLARQHYRRTRRSCLEPLGVSRGAAHGQPDGQAATALAHEAIRTGEWDVIIGTHALITEGVAYQNLGLVVTDEQHRFGVRQRTMLGEKGDAPNVLVMSATPIPRTLSLILYRRSGHLHRGRAAAGAHARGHPHRAREPARGAVRLSAQRGSRRGGSAYVVCPLVEESEAVEALPAEQVYEDLRTQHLPDLRIELVHGRMTARRQGRGAGALPRGRGRRTGVHHGH